MPSLLPGSMTLFTLDSEIWGLFACLLVVTVIMAYGIYCDIKRARKARVAGDIHSTMIFATHHILNNFLNGMELVRMEANNSKDFDKNIIVLYEEAYREAMHKIDRISNLTEPTQEKIWDALVPGMRPPA
jgi:hypothetical protein